MHIWEGEIETCCPLNLSWGATGAAGLCDSGCLSSGSATPSLQLPRQAGRRNLHITPGSFPSHSLISDIHIKTNLGGLGVILETDVENTAKGWQIFQAVEALQCNYAGFKYCTTTTPQSRSDVCFISVLRAFCLFFPIDLILISINSMSLLSPATEEWWNQCLLQLQKSSILGSFL